MPRNFFRRIEVVFPIEDGNLRERIISELLALPLQDNVKARFLGVDGTYSKRKHRRGEAEFRSQAEFIARTLQPALAEKGRAKSRYPRSSWRAGRRRFPGNNNSGPETFLRTARGTHLKTGGCRWFLRFVRGEGLKLRDKLGGIKSY